MKRWLRACQALAKRLGHAAMNAIMRLSWSPAPGQVDRYTLNVNGNAFDVPGDQTQTEVSLAENSNHSVNVTAINGAGPGPTASLTFSTPVYVITPPLEPPGSCEPIGAEFVRWE